MAAAEAPPATQGPRYVPVKQLKGHKRGVARTVFSPDGTKLASASADKTAIIWDTASGTVLHVLGGHERGLSDIAWSASGEHLVTASDDATARVWEGKCVVVLRGHTNYIMCVDYNPQMDLVATGSHDESVRVWNAKDGTCQKVLPAHSDPVTSVQFHPTGTLLLTASFDGVVYVPVAAKPVMTGPLASTSRTRVPLHPDLRRLWDVASGQCMKTLIDDLSPAVSHARFSPNGKYILASTLNSEIRLWDYQKASSKGSFVRQFRGHVNKQFCLFTDFATVHGVHVVSGSEDGTVCIWDLQSKALVQQLEGHSCVPISVSCHPTLPVLATSTLEPENSIVLWVDQAAPAPVAVATSAPSAFDGLGLPAGAPTAAAPPVSAAPTAPSATAQGQATAGPLPASSSTEGASQVPLPPTGGLKRPRDDGGPQ